VTARRVLVAGVGNIFLGDDGFGVEVVTRLAAARRARCRCCAWCCRRTRHR
jgi:Ni,Fe-hydrogenase maturation factor